MACYFRQNSEASISIPKFVVSSTGVTYYDIKVRVQQVEWVVERRYRDFAQLQQKLLDEVDKYRKALPPKKILGNKKTEFVEQRRSELEQYLKDLLVHFRPTLPRSLAEFLHFNKYDIVYLLQDLALLFHENGDAWLSCKKEFNLSTLEVYAISERLNLPCPPDNVSAQRGKYDFSHVLDFCSQLETLVVTPVRDDNSTFGNEYNTVDVPIGCSNIIPQRLTFNLNAFRNLRTLKFYGLSTENIADITCLRPTLTSICVHQTTITHAKQVLMCDHVHRDAIDAAGISAITALPSNIGETHYVWKNLQELNISGNLLTQIDGSIRLAPKLRELVLEQNRLRGIKYLAELPQLQTLSLAVNLIADCQDWHLELGNLVSLNLSQNRITRLVGLRKLMSLVNLDLSCNLIDELEEVDHIAGLPILENLRLTGNPLASKVDYRPRVLSRFHERAAEISLDNERGTHKELDTALVLSALLKSKLRQQSNS